MRSSYVPITACLVLQWMAVLLDQTDIYYNPRIILNRITPLSWLFYLSYAVFLLLPMELQIAGEISFRKKVLKENATFFYCPPSKTML